MTHLTADGKIPYYNGEPGIAREDDFYKIPAQRWTTACLTERRAQRDTAVCDLDFESHVSDFLRVIAPAKHMRRPS